MPLTPKIFLALLQNVSDLEMFKTKIKKIHKILTLLWTFKVAMFSFSTALWEVWALANWWRWRGNRVFYSLVDLGDDFSAEKLHVSPVYLLVMKWFNWVFNRFRSLRLYSRIWHWDQRKLRFVSNTFTRSSQSASIVLKWCLLTNS